ncbi:3-hydroxyisobutyrate dehydrogenase-like beta-hydroxyacid dehydrogenase [Bacillus sp. SORGH_AS 510]|uniref:NAD(P)-dependent oxidoreductase n=1 Tax=Bacillus sp. SORGH_AS_0510 TaxID=3041771 RepID=UPI00278352E7|nr:NAD(P)-dependent oxidoreductase [Bacillus sp. SORGH_AS_0510]MDQ1145659.1 3-hydroxyisobutyrate dehydrogenase-like beta-hydroxyacid dehydrogenase [Bacillus sp. SORGH_AS_0510]
MSVEIGFIGLGNMGQPMVLNLLKAGYKVKVYNRTPSKTAIAVKAGAQQVHTLADVVTPGGIVVTMVSNDQSLEEIVLGTNGFGERLGTGGIHLSMSTVSPEISKKLAAFHQQNGSHYVASPVFGRPEAAAAQKLNILSSGQSEAKERVKPVQEAMGQRVFDIGEEPGAANVIKLGGNFMIMAAMEAMAESFNLAEKHGIDRELAAEVYSSTLFACTVYQGYGEMIAKKLFEPAGFQLGLGLKDCNLVIDEANSTKTPMPLANLLQNRLLTSVEKGRENQDWSALARISLEEAGLE